MFIVPLTFVDVWIIGVKPYVNTENIYLSLLTLDIVWTTFIPKETLETTLNWAVYLKSVCYFPRFIISSVSLPSDVPSANSRM